LSLQQLIELSQFYGENPQWVLVGGGNTSVKVKNTLYVKASGTTLATASEATFVKMDRKRLAGVLKKEYPADAEVREQQALQDLLDAREPDQQLRPSVETLMHEILPFTFVIHTHPTMVNGITCSNDAESAARRVYGDDMLWIPNVNPGLILATTIRDAVDRYKEQYGKAPWLILMQNHGLVVGGDSGDEVRARHKEVIARLKGHIPRQPELDTIPYDKRRAETLSYQISRAAQELHPGEPDYLSVFLCNREVFRFVRSAKAFTPLSRAFTPDHIVYAGHRIPFIRATDDFGQEQADIREAMSEFLKQTGRIPPVIAYEGLGVYITGRNRRMMDAAAALFLDAVQVAVYTQAFGGAAFLPEPQTQFILNWEVERFRAQASAGE
jgi:rhamnose utilization protein RhaD (predicted bifunctional aldolase and dehydrogenase)